MNTDFKKERTDSIVSMIRRIPACKLSEAAAEIVRSWRAAVEIVETVEDVVGQKGLPCPVQSQDAICALRHALGGIKACKPRPSFTAPEEDKPKESQKPAAVSCGEGPYRARIVSARSRSDVYWESRRNYDTEEAAVSAILRKANAEARKTQCWRVTPYTRHWVTERREHVIDFGSHSLYGVVSGKETT